MAYRVLSKTLSFILVVVVLGFAGIAYGDKDADKRTAGNSKLTVKERMAACDVPMMQSKTLWNARQNWKKNAKIRASSRWSGRGSMQSK